MSINRFALILAVFFALLLALILVAPWLTPEGCIQGLDGDAWQLNHREKWRELPPVPQLAYTLGDLLCHQREERSFLLNGNQVPVCARDLGLLTGLTLGLGLAVTACPHSRLEATAAELLHLPAGKLIAIVIAILLTPLVVDGLLQLMTSYESVNEVRILTGLLFGLGLSTVTGTLLLTDPRLEQ